MPFETMTLGEKIDAIAPDGSEIRLLGAMSRSSAVHCTLPSGGVLLAVRHKSIEEIWYFVSGVGEVWRSLDDDAVTVSVLAGISVTIPTGVHFQFRNTGEAPLCFVIATAPPWPGEQEAERVPDHWPTD